MQVSEEVRSKGRLVLRPRALGVTSTGGAVLARKRDRSSERRAIWDRTRLLPGAKALVQRGAVAVAGAGVAGSARLGLAV